MSQIMKLSYFPQIKVVHTSKLFHGQLYVPLVNWLLMVGTVLAAAIYNNVSLYTASAHNSITDKMSDHLSRKCIWVLIPLIL